MTRRDAADLLTGIASLVENYPSDKVLLTINVEVPTVGEESRRRAPADASSKRTRGRKAPGGGRT